jgi:hypothetical protein
MAAISLTTSGRLASSKAKFGEVAVICSNPKRSAARPSVTLNGETRASYLWISKVQRFQSASALLRAIPWLFAKEKLLPFTQQWSASTIGSEARSISRSSPYFIGGTGPVFFSRRVSEGVGKMLVAKIHDSGETFGPQDVARIANRLCHLAARPSGLFQPKALIDAS